MFKYLKVLFLKFREYIVLFSLLLISLIFISQNDSAGVKSFRTLAFGYYAVINSLPTYFIDLFKDDSKIEFLEKENAELMMQLNLLRKHGLENDRLRDLLSFKDSSNFTLIPSSIVSKRISKSDGYFVLNKGFEDSIKVGMPVINNLGFVGIITEVSRSFSVLRILLNVNSKITVTNERSNLDGVLAFNGLSLIIKNIPTTYDFKIGDRILISNLSVVAPPRIPLGLVVDKEKTAAGLLSNIIVDPFVNFSELKYVFIIDIVPSKEINNLELNLFK